MANLPEKPKKATGAPVMISVVFQKKPRVSQPKLAVRVTVKVSAMVRTRGGKAGSGSFFWNMYVAVMVGNWTRSRFAL